MARVIDCRAVAPMARQQVYREQQPPPSRRAGVLAGLLVAMLLVPLAGAIEPPLGWVATGLTALAVLALAALAGQRVPWGWLAVLIGLASVFAPRGGYVVIGAVLFVACVLCGVVWFAGRGRSEAYPRRRTVGWREQQKQQLAGLTGELRVRQFLAHQLPEDYVVINALKLPRGAGDIDHLVIGPSGVFLLETKTMAGLIECAPDGTWRRTKMGRAGTPYSAFIGDPAAQVQRNIHAVRDCLRRRAAELLRRHPLWIEGLVVFPHPRTELFAEHSRVATARLDDAPALILGNRPDHALEPADVGLIAAALLAELRNEEARPLRTVQSAQALVEVALALPVVLALVFGTLALSRIIQTQTAIVAIAHEAARAAALGSTADDAVQRMLRRVDLVTPGFGLDPHAVVTEWDVSRFGSDPGRVTAVVRYTVEPWNLPLVSWLPATTLRAEHVEFVDSFRSGVVGQ